MPEITIEQSTFERLQRHAHPLLDTTDSVINHALDSHELHAGTPVSPNKLGNQERQIDPRMLPNLTHTKILQTSINGEQIDRPNWNLLLNTMLIKSMKQLGDYKKLQQLCPVNIVKGRKEDEGYGYLPEIDISVQGQDANAACRTIVTASQGLGIDIDIGFMWRQKENAAHPGERARIQLSSLKQTDIAVTSVVG